MIEPAFAAFAAEHDKGRGQLLFTRLVADMETPVSAFLKLGDGKDNAFLLKAFRAAKRAGAIPSLVSSPT